MQTYSACGAAISCQQCPKAVGNAIIYASHSRGFHLPAQKCEENIMIFLLEGEALVNSQEYAGTILRAGEFILQAIGSKYEILALTDVECVCYRFNQPEFFCEERYKYIMKEIAFLSGRFQSLSVEREDLPGTAFVQTKRTCLSFRRILLRL